MCGVPLACPKPAIAATRTAATIRIVIDEFETCYRITEKRDASYDGVFFIAVTSTRVYCRPSCAARMPKRANARFYPSAAAAEAAGYRPCKRCRPDAGVGSPEWTWRSDLVTQATCLITACDSRNLAHVAERLGFSERHLRRLLTQAVGMSPRTLARAQRARRARTLIESTSLPFAQVAFAAGFGSVRQFNETVKELFGATPTELRRRGVPSRSPQTAPQEPTRRARRCCRSARGRQDKRTPGWGRHHKAR